MDCHLKDTEWQLLGVFKIDNISADNGFMEQSFKHEGVCVWGEDTYSFASKAREYVPTDCTQTGSTDENGNYLYYHAKPAMQGNITLGLYTDYLCMKEYDGQREYNVFNLAGVPESYVIAFNEAMDIWKICQPCVAYNLGEEDFQCYDEAGYTNCNQVNFSCVA